MKEPTKIERFIHWLFHLFDRYDCRKERHQWGYTLSESGIVYMDESKVPKELWKCLKCHCNKEYWEKNLKNK